MDGATWIWLALGVVVAIVVTSVWIAGAVYLLRRVFRDHGSGWRGLASRFATTLPAPASALRGVTAQVGAVRYRNCAMIAVLPEGLYLATWFPRRPPLLAPWSAIASLEETRVYWQPYLRLQFHDAALSPVAIPGALAAAARAYWTAACCASSERQSQLPIHRPSQDSPIIASAVGARSLG